jgi:hypothetical protein
MQDFRLNIPDFAPISSATHTIIAVVEVILIQTIILLNQVIIANAVDINTTTYNIVPIITQSEVKTTFNIFGDFNIDAALKEANKSQVDFYIAHLNKFNLLIISTADSNNLATKGSYCTTNKVLFLFKDPLD